MDSHFRGILALRATAMPSHTPAPKDLCHNGRKIGPDSLDRAGKKGSQPFPPAEGHVEEQRSGSGESIDIPEVGRTTCPQSSFNFLDQHQRPFSYQHRPTRKRTVSREITFTLPIVELRILSGQRIVTPLGFDGTFQFGLTAQKAAEHFRRAAQRHLLQQGEFLDFMQQRPPLSWKLDRFQLEIAADPKGEGFDPQRIELDYIHWSNASHTLGVVPVLGVGGTAASRKELIEQLEESTKLYLFRTGRTRSLRDLVALQWYDTPEIKPIEIEAVFPTPKELDSYRRGEADRLLPTTARQMDTPTLPAFGMETQIEELERSLRGQFRQSVMVLGPPGSGKSALIGEYISTSALPQKERPWRTSAARLLQVLTESGGWQYQLGLWCREVREAGAVVNVGPLYELFEVGQYSGNDVSIAEALRDPLQRGEVTLICEATAEQLERMERRSPGYGDLFVKIDLGERKPQEQDRIIVQAAERLAGKYKVALHQAAVRKLVALQRRYSPYSGFPGKRFGFWNPC